MLKVLEFQGNFARPAARRFCKIFRGFSLIFPQGLERIWGRAARGPRGRLFKISRGFSLILPQGLERIWGLGAWGCGAVSCLKIRGPPGWRLARGRPRRRLPARALARANSAARAASCAAAASFLLVAGCPLAGRGFSAARPAAPGPARLGPGCAQRASALAPPGGARPAARALWRLFSAACVPQGAPRRAWGRRGAWSPCCSAL